MSPPFITAAARFERGYRTRRWLKHIMRKAVKQAPVVQSVAAAPGGGSRALITVTRQIQEARQEYDRMLAAKEPLWFSMPEPVDHNPLHFRFSLNVYAQLLPQNYWVDGRFEFDIMFPDDYNTVPPKMRCLTRIFHPNIDDTTGKICASFLDDSKWVPTHTILSMLQSMYVVMFQDPNGHDPLPDCKHAAELLLSNPEEFKRRARRHMQEHGTYIPDSRSARGAWGY